MIIAKRPRRYGELAGEAQIQDFSGNKHLLGRKRHLEKSKAQVKKKAALEAESKGEARKQQGGKMKQSRGARPKAEQHSSSWEAVAMYLHSCGQIVTPKGVLPLALCHASATHEGP